MTQDLHDDKRIISKFCQLRSTSMSRYVKSKMKWQIQKLFKRQKMLVGVL